MTACQDEICENQTGSSQYGSSGSTSRNQTDIGVMNKQDSPIETDVIMKQISTAKTYKEEFKQVIMLAFPIVLTTVFQNLQGTIAIIFCGHLGDKLLLDGAALAISMINVTCLAIGQGMGTACDTFFSQTLGSSRHGSQIFGSSHKKKIGIYVQRSLFIFWLVLSFLYVIHMNLESILLTLGQEPAVAKLASHYILLFMPGAFSYFCYVVLSKYILNQNRTIPMVIIGIISNLVNAALHYILVYILRLGITGSAISISLAYLSALLMTLSYIICSKMYKLTWDGWSVESLRDWGPFVKLSMAGMVMVCVEWWAFEIGVFLSGILGETELGAQSVVMQLDNMYFQIPLGMQTTCCIRVGQYLGSGDAKGAKRTSWVAIIITGLITLIFAVLFSALRMQLPWLFTNVKDVVYLTAGLLPLVAAYTFFDSVSATCKGVLHGSGRQIYGAVILIISYYFVVFPIAAPLMFLTTLRSYGYWWTMAGSLIVQCCIFLGIVFKTNWEFQVEKAAKRTGDIAETMDTEPNETTGLLESSDSADEKTPRKRFYSASLTSTEIKALTHKSKNIPLKKLIFRRLLTAGVFLSIFTAGVLVRIFVKVPMYHVTPPCVPSNSSIAYNSTVSICDTTDLSLTTISSVL